MKRTILLSAVFALACASAFAQNEDKPITLRTMGSLLFGGTVETLPNGETFHGDHGYAQYFIPQDSRTYPVIMWHGIGQSGRSYESTPDGREGYMAILPRRDWSIYIVDQPRRGRAGYTSSQVNTSQAVPTIMKESAVWEAFRNGMWLTGEKPSFFPNTQFPKTADAIDQFFRQQTPDTGEEPRTKECRDYMGKTMADLLAQTGPAILVTHSNSGQYGWSTAMAAPDKVKAIVAYEPGACAFPVSDMPADLEPSPIALCNETQAPQPVSDEEFAALTKMPIIIVYCDNIATEPTDKSFNSEVWRVALHRARQFVETVNRHGGNARLLHLPEVGIEGNTHAPFADLNNEQIADLLEQFLHENKLDGKENPHKGPARKGLKQPTIPVKL